MTYRIAGLDPQLFAPLFALDDGALAARHACRIEATSDRGYPCRISLDDARKGEPVILAQFVSHPVQTPFRFAYAIYIRAGVEQAEYFDRTPPAFAGRYLALRGFTADAMLEDAILLPPDGDDPVDAAVRALFANPRIAYIHAHYAVNGCFAALIERN